MTSSSSAQRLVPITDLAREYAAIQKDLAPLLEKIFRSGGFILGAELARFEKELASYLTVRHAIGVNSGTDALLLALRALDIKSGDEVIVPAMSFFATVEPILHLGAKPVFVDIEPDTYTLDPGKVSARISSATKAIIAVHLYGLPADLKALSVVLKEKQIPLVEDMAQAIGSTLEGKKIGSLGDMACVSFYPTKNLGACGDGGAVVTSSDRLAEHLRSLRNHGAKVKYYHEEAAYNSRLDEIQAAILRLKLPFLDAWNDKRRMFATQYHTALKDLPVVLPIESKDRHHVYHLYSIQAERRDELKAFLEKEGISTGLHYPIPLHLLPALKYLGHHEKEFPVSEQLAHQTLSLPLYPFMSTDDVLYVSDAIRRFYETRA
jgi:dTDP-4-amino-4,6-dideoxygalactose transaminase